MKNSRLLHLKKIFSMGILIFAFKDASAQTNLIANGGFETTQQAVTYRQGATWLNQTFATGWQRPNDGTPDIFVDNPSAYNQAYNTANLTCWPDCYVNDNAFGNQYPRIHTILNDGETYANHNYLMLFFSGEYAQFHLASPLVAGSCYELSFWVNRADVDQYAAHMEAVVSVSNLHTSGSAPLAIPQNNAVYLTTASQHPSYITSKTNWTKITFDFKATGGEEFVTIGNFDQDFSLDLNAPSDCGSTFSCSSGCPSTGLIASTIYFYDDVKLFAVAGGTFPLPITYTNTTLNSSPPAGSNILVTGNVTINGNVNWNNCQVRCNTNAQITIATGSTLTLQNGTVLKAGCDMMWKGIVVNGTGKFIMDKSTIQDAIRPLIFNDASGWQIGGTSSQNSHFDRNVFDIIMNGNSQYSSTNFIKCTTFDQTAQLLDPTQSYTGYGYSGIICNGTGAGNLETIGGTNSSDACTFIGGQYGIQSNNKNLNVTQCNFTNVQQVAIDFHGDPSQSVIRTLTVTSCTGTNNNRCILSQTKTNLTVQKCNFSNSTQHAIEWNGNHDCHLLVGDSLDATQGNTFQNNGWAAVAAWDSKSAQSNFTTLATNNTNAYTSIVIANNTITGQSYESGILLGEWALGSNVSYHIIYTEKNSITGIVKGIQAFNIKGWSGAFNLTPAFPLPPSAINRNQISVSTTSVPTPWGINSENTQGLSFGYNLISSDNPYNWQNIGIRLQNAEFTSIYNNGIEAGTGISVGLDMLSSNIYCNILQNNTAGIVLGWAYLRPDNLHPHGSVLKAYSNAFIMDQPATVNIHNYYSDVAHNNWVWDPFVTPTAPKLWYSDNSIYPTNTTPNQSPSSMITSFTGTFDCPYDPSMIMVASGGTNVHATMSDANAQWRADYAYEIQRMNTGIGNAAIASANIKSIIGIENNIGAGNYQDALTALGSFTATNTIEANYKTVLTIFANLNYPEKRDPTETEIANLSTVAQQFTRAGGAAVTLARAYLMEKYNLFFKDEQFTAGVAYGTADLSSPCSFSPNPQTSIGFIDAEGNDAGITGTVESDGTFTFDPYQIAYANSLNPDTTYRIYSKYGSKYTVVNKDFKTLTDWVSFSPFSLYMSGVQVQSDITDTKAFDGIAPYTSVTDENDNVYSVGAVMGTDGTDFFLKKKDKNGDLIWMQTYDGAVHGNDTATCITLGSDGFIYVAGKVWNGKNYDMQALKYDADGYMQWQSVLADLSTQNNYPTGIILNGDMTVSATGTRKDGTTTTYRLVNWAQCIPSGSRLAHLETPQAPTFSMIEFYPNPADNKLNIVLKNSDGGKLELFNMEGQLVFSQQIIKSGEVELPQNQVPDGLYLLKFTGVGQPQFNKLVIHHNQ